MRLGGLVLGNYCNINDFEYPGSLQINEGDQTTVYIQLVDLNKKLCADLNGSCYLRYIPDAPASLIITVDSIDDAQVITKVATQVSASDPSIWCFVLNSNETLGSANLHLQLTEPGPKVSSGVINNAILVNMVGSGNGQSFC